MLAGLGTVDVRVGAVADEAVGRLHHLRRDVGVVVEADGDRHVRADGGAHAAQQLALAVLERLADHGAVQVEVDGIDGQRLGEAADELAGDALVGIGGDEAAGAAAGPQQRHDVVRGPHVAQEAREREAGVAEPFDDVRSAHQRRAVAVAGEVGVVGPLRDEAVGLVMEAADGDAGHARDSQGRCGLVREVSQPRRALHNSPSRPWWYARAACDPYSRASKCARRHSRERGARRRESRRQTAAVRDWRLDARSALRLAGMTAQAGAWRE